MFPVSLSGSVAHLITNITSYSTGLNLQLQTVDDLNKLRAIASNRKIGKTDQRNLLLVVTLYCLGCNSLLSRWPMANKTY